MKLLLKALKIIFITVSSFLVFCLVFAFTTGPFWLYYRMGTSEGKYDFKPEYIIIMGGAGYPSETALMRSWYAAKVFHQSPQSIVIITQPAADGVQPELSDAWGIRKDLIIRGVDSTKILLEIKGKNTREEGLEVLRIAPDAKDAGCVLVTAPEHMMRSIRVFKKLGFNKLGGVATFNASGPVDLDYKDKDLGGRSLPLPDVGGSIQLRYQFWNHLRYQVICYRELAGLAWYKLKGWI
jgi:uncharacterized SAM-binding protein YcdF (DUF218 family)